MDRFELKSLDLCKVILQIDETVDPEKQQFLQDKAIKAETKDIVVEGKEENRKEKREEKEEEEMSPRRDDNNNNNNKKKR